VIEYSNRSSIELIIGYERFIGTIEAAEVPTLVRDLHEDQCRMIAAKASPVARQLESHGRWLQRMNRTSPSIIRGVFLQAQHERLVHVANSHEAYLSLLEVYLQRSVVDQMRSVLVESEEAIESFRNAGIEIPGDPTEVQRRKMDVEQQSSDLRMNQNKLNRGIESLLELIPQTDLPIWTSFNVSTRSPVPTEALATHTALSSRKDLQALETIERGSHCHTSEEMKGLSSGNPFLGSSISIPGTTKCFQISLKKKIAELKRSENIEYQRQLHDSVVILQNKIQLEVMEALQNISNHLDRLRVTKNKLTNFQNSLDAETKAKDQRPVDPAVRTAKEIEALKAVSEMIHESIAVEIAYVQLERAMGSPLAE